jgi:hypothetical protein
MSIFKVESDTKTAWNVLIFCRIVDNETPKNVYYDKF